MSQLQLFQPVEVQMAFYLLAISPVQQVSQRITAYKKELTKELGNGHSLLSKPHISLFGFPFNRLQQEKLLLGLKETVSNIPSFKIALQGFGHFPNSGTIYVNPEYNAQFEMLYQRVAHLLRNSFKVEGKYASKNFTPHVTVVKELTKKPEVFKRLWSDFCDREFHDSFEVADIQLLRYEEGENGKTTLVKTFHLQAGHLN